MPARPALMPLRTTVQMPRRRLLAGLAATSGLALLPPARADSFEEISWDDLAPADWDPASDFDDVQHLSQLPDSDPRVQALYERMRKVWDEAPVVPALEGRAVRIPGYLVPIEAEGAAIHEFLLVPYFGACIHTPPPPANQIIHVRASPPIRGFETMSAVWVSGILGIERSDSALGVSGYRLKAVKTTAFTDR